MSEREKYEVAKQYVDGQLKAMKSSGSAPKNLSTADYELMVKKVASAITCK